MIKSLLILVIKLSSENSWILPHNFHFWTIEMRTNVLMVSELNHFQHPVLPHPTQDLSTESSPGGTAVDNHLSIVTFSRASPLDTQARQAQTGKGESERHMRGGLYHKQAYLSGSHQPQSYDFSLGHLSNLNLYVRPIELRRCSCMLVRHPAGS